MLILLRQVMLVFPGENHYQSMKKNPVSNHYIHACLRGVKRSDADVYGLLERAGIPVSYGECSRQRITEVQLAELIRAVWRETGDEFMGLTARRCKNGVFALMMESLFQFETLGAMLQQSIRFYNAVQDDVAFTFEQSDGVVDISATLRSPEYDPDHLMQEFVLLMWQRLSCWLVNTRIPFHTVRFNYAPPAHVTEYPLMFGENLVFNQSSCGFTFSSRLLTLPKVRDPIEMADFLRASPLEILRRVGTDSSLRLQVRRQIMARGLQPAPTLEMVAGSLHMTSRTLRRKLKEECTSFQQIKDQVRCEAAVRLLTEEAHTVAQTAILVGFTEQAAFCRAFKSWTGRSPGHFLSQLGRC